MSQDEALFSTIVHHLVCIHNYPWITEDNECCQAVQHSTSNKSADVSTPSTSMHKEAESLYSQMVIDLLRLSTTTLLTTKAWVMQHCSSSASVVTPVWRNT